MAGENDARSFWEKYKRYILGLVIAIAMVILLVMLGPFAMAMLFA